MDDRRQDQRRGGENRTTLQPRTGSSWAADPSSRGSGEGSIAAAVAPSGES